MGVANYDVAVMNYPLFEKGRLSGEEANKLFARPRYTDIGGPWPVSLYIHIPFCDSLCDFCVYNRMLAPGNRGLVQEFVDALIREIALYAREWGKAENKLDAVFIGGGTPTALSASQLEKILQALHRCFDLHGSEMTVECNPLNATREKLAVCKRYGVTRISTGVQSFQNSLRKSHHIAKRAEAVAKWLEELRAFHFDDESLDLLYGFPDGEEVGFLSDVKRAAAMKMGHISLYKLAAFAYTTLYKKLLSSKGEGLPDDESCFAMFQKAHRLLLQKGYILQSAQEYGIKGKTTRFWDATYDGFGDNLAMGVSSFGYVNGYCYQNTNDVREYIRRLQDGCLPVERCSLPITPEQLRERAVILGFRRGYVLREPFAAAFGTPLERVFGETVEKLIAQGLMEEHRERFSLTEKGLYYQGNVSAAFMLSVFEGVSPLKKKMCIGAHEMP